MKNTITFLESLTTKTKQAILVIIDILIIEFSLWLTFHLQNNFEADLPTSYMPVFILMPAIMLPVFIRLGLYRAVMRYVGQRVLEQVLKGVLFSVLLLFALAQIFQLQGFVVSQLVIYGSLTLSFIGSSRFIIRHLIDATGSQNTGRPVAIYGAGSAGRQLLKMLQEGREYKPVLFIDGSKKIQGREVDGIIVINPEEGRLINSLREKNIHEIFLAIPSASHRRRKQILKSLENLPYHVRSVPGVEDMLNGARLDQLEEIKIEDLLGRDPVPPVKKLINKCIKNKVVMVTGAGGSIGSELCRQIIQARPNQLIMVEQSEYLLYRMEQEFAYLENREDLNIKVVPLLLDVCNEQQVSYFLNTFNVDTIYHAAAYKHVPIVEHNIVIGVENNILGTYVMATQAMVHNVANFVLISTDKAVRPTNVMGASKRMAEIVLQAMSKVEPLTNFCMVRFGNVLGSSGSVVPLFRKQIANGGPITLTHEDITRYFMTIPEAAQLVIQAGAMSQGGDVFVLDMGKPIKIVDLAKSMVHLMGLDVRDDENPNGDIEIKVIGLRPGEKLYEELLIGENVSGTNHPKIMRAEEVSLSFDEMNVCMDELREAISAHNIKGIRATLLGNVNGYNPKEDIVDHGYANSKSASIKLVSLQDNIH